MTAEGPANAGVQSAGQSQAEAPTAPLAGTRVLDLTDHRGEVGGYVLAELGADVIKIEPPGGTPARRQATRFAAYNSNKRSVCVDLTSVDGQATFNALVGTAELLLRSEPDGLTSETGYTHERLAQLNDRLVDVAITPFGAEGPRVGDPASELSIACLGGSANLQGTPDRPPVKASIPQVWRHAGAEAAAAGLIARAHQRATGGGAQQVTVSAQAAVTWTLLNAMETHAICGRDFQRTGTEVALAVPLQIRLPTLDGHVIAISRGAAVGRLLEWLIEEQLAPASWRQEDWETFDLRATSGEQVAYTFDELSAAVTELCSRYTNDQLMRRGLECGETLAPVHSVTDLLTLTHLRERKLWVSSKCHVELQADGTATDGAGTRAPEGTPVELPGGFATIWGERVGGRRQTPAPDEHGDAIRAELADLASRAPAATASASSGHPAGSADPPPQPDGWPANHGLPFAGLKVADFSWIGVGPITAKAFADHGATVVRVESNTRLDGLRVNPPFKDDVFDVDMAHFFATFNTSKRSIDVDLHNPAGVEVARRLAGWADVLIESWTPGAFARRGLTDEALHQINPSLVIVHTSLMASGGELSALAGFGYHAAAIAGFYPTVGWPDRPPDGPYLAYTDTISPRFITSTIAAVLEQRARTGQGCVVEAAQLECGLQFLAPEIADYQLTGHVASRTGNRDAGVAPQGVYPCAGDDRWIGITVDTDARWVALAEVLGRPEWGEEAHLASAAGREAAHDELDERIAAVTATWDAQELERRLAAADVPAGVVQRSSDLLADPQYAARRFYRYHDHPAMGVVPYAGHQYQIAGYDHGPRTAAPTLGQHTHHVLVDLLGYTDDEIAELAVSGALG